MNKEQIIKKLKLVTAKKEKAITVQRYQKALPLRQKEKELLQHLEELSISNE